MQQSTTDATYLAAKAYRDGTQLWKRKALYDFMAPRYSLEEEVIKLLGVEGNETVLDVGCGTGELLLKIAERQPKAQLTGIDISSGIFKPAQERARQQDLNIHFYVADVQSLPFPEASFDRVTALHMLYHVPDIDKALQEMKRVLKPEGRLVVSTNSIASKPELRRLGQRAAQLMDIPEHAPVSARFALEDGAVLLRKYFPCVEVHHFQSAIKLTQAAPGVEYFDSARDLWEPRPSDAQWQVGLQLVRQEIQTAIDTQGVFEDRNVFGVLVALDRA